MLKFYTSNALAPNRPQVMGAGSIARSSLGSSKLRARPRPPAGPRGAMVARRTARGRADADVSHARLSPFQRGMIYMGSLAGMTMTDIAAKVRKSDGCFPSVNVVKDTIQKAEAHGGSAWDGVPHGHPGRPRETLGSLDREISKLVYKMRGSAVVTAAYVRRVIKAARKTTVRTVQRRLREAGLRWLRRRRKTLLTQEHMAARLAWVVFTVSQTPAMLSRWAYTDGTSFYLARTAEEHLDKRRAALGTHVWRAADGHDALFQDCVGPSAYAKAQGSCVRIWGLLFAGMLCIYVLPQGEVMNTEWYTWIIENKFRAWLDAAHARSTRVFLVQDHERCLWADEPLDALEDENIQLLEEFPKCSQDLNPIEVAWREVKARMDDTMPTKAEPRLVFLRRLHRAVAWVNANRAEYFWYLCHAQKKWAQDVWEAQPPGARTPH